jgi:dTDP-4-dehydrorhamnose reductase
MSAHEDALSEYGKHKFKLEQIIGTSDAAILKLGLVMGETGGLFLSIKLFTLH